MFSLIVLGILVYVTLGTILLTIVFRPSWSPWNHFGFNFIKLMFGWTVPGLLVGILIWPLLIGLELPRRFIAGRRDPLRRLVKNARLDKSTKQDELTIAQGRDYKRQMMDHHFNSMYPQATRSLNENPPRNDQ